MQKLAERFRKEAAQYFGNRRRLKYPPQIRQLAEAYIAEAIAAGSKAADISKALRIDVNTTYVWGGELGLLTRPNKKVVKRVRIVEAAPVATRPKYLLHSNVGLRIECDAASSVAELLRELSCY